MLLYFWRLKLKSFYCMADNFFKEFASQPEKIINTQETNAFVCPCSFFSIFVSVHLHGVAGPCILLITRSV